VERLLVTGVDGPIGINLALKLAEHFDVLGLCATDGIEPRCPRTAAWQPADKHACEQLVRDFQPAWILHCGPLAASSWDPAPSESAAEREPVVVARLADLARDLPARLTVLSSDAVFCGPRMFHDESSTPGGSSPRAAWVRKMEQSLRGRDVLVARTHAYGWSPLAAHAGFAERSLEALAAGAVTPMDGRRHATPILATDLAELLLRAYEMRLQGLYHMAGAERTSPFRFVSELAGVFDLHLPASRFEIVETGADERDMETSLSSKRARRQLEMAAPMLRDGLVRFAEQEQHGWRGQFRERDRVRCEVAA
jgi:dTDP-4-dehydrorhamnose reductase